MNSNHKFNFSKNRLYFDNDNNNKTVRLTTYIEQDFALHQVSFHVETCHNPLYYTDTLISFFL